MSVLQNIQEQLKAKKSKYNNFGKYAYRSAEDILEALKPLLAKHQYSVVIKDDIEQVGHKMFLKTTVNLFDERMQLVTSTQSFAEHPESLKGMSPMQVTGSASSYAKKYALGNMFLIDDSQDSDAMKPPTQEVKYVSPEQVKYIYTMISTKEIDEVRVKQAYGVESMNELTSEQALKLIQQLKAK